MKINSGRTIMTTFGTQLRPLNLKEGNFILKKDSESTMDTPISEYIGTKRMFKKRKRGKRHVLAGSHPRGKN